MAIIARRLSDALLCFAARRIEIERSSNRKREEMSYSK